MRQVFLSYKTGEIELAEVPVPKPAGNELLVRTAASVVSVGTEEHLARFARKSLVGKALARPDQLRRVLEKARLEGVREAWRQAMGRLDSPLPLGYTSAGTIVEIGPEVTEFQVGERVACSGSGYAGHADYVAVPESLCAGVPEGLSMESAAFVAVGGIALQAIRMADVALGSRVAVIGLGLIGQIVVQLLRAGGCRTLGLDLDPQRVELALERGLIFGTAEISQLVTRSAEVTGGDGVDAVIIAAATSSNEPLEWAGQLCRERGRVVATGMVGLEVPRKDFYDKELDLVVSRGWGPGMYDAEYLSGRSEYPVAYARWTARRNLKEFLQLLADGAVSVEPLLTHRYPISDALRAYELILDGQSPSLGVVIEYGDQPEAVDPDARIVRVEAGGRSREPFEGAIGVALIGAGQFASGTLMPLLEEQSGVRMVAVATRSGLSGSRAAKRLGCAYSTTDVERVLADPEVQLVLVLTRHGSHADLVSRALRAGKDVFVEKPLAISVQQLRRVVTAWQETLARGREPRLMVGFNRRYSPCGRWLKERLEGRGPFTIHCTVNAGQVPGDHWVHDPVQGGGRILGEVCHFVDLVRYLSGSRPVRAFAQPMESDGYEPSDNVVMTLQMEDGSIASIDYASVGDKGYPRERIEVMGGGAVGVIEDFKRARFFAAGRRDKKRLWNVDRGHVREMRELVTLVREGAESGVMFEKYVETTVATLALQESARRGEAVEIDEFRRGPRQPER